MSLKKVFKIFKAQKYYKSKEYDFQADMENFKIINGGKYLKHMAGCVDIIRLRVILESLRDRFYH
jgi:hypothetical protein